MYHTPDGDRILEGAERHVFIHSLAFVVDLLATGETEFGVDAFDELQRTQQLFVLYRSARGLLHPDEPMPKLTAALESSVAVVYRQLCVSIELEIDGSDESGEETFWRGLVLDAASDHGGSSKLPAATETNMEDWAIVIEFLRDRVLWDDDYDIREGLDLPPEKSKRIREKLGMAEEYLTEVPHDPPDAHANLYLDALMGLTAQAR